MLEWILSSTVLILIVMGLRRAWKGKISLRLQYALWALVLARLLIPFSFSNSEISVQNIAAEVAEGPAVQAVTRMELPRQSYEQAYEQVVQEFTAKGVDVSTVQPVQLEAEVTERMSSHVTLGQALVTAAKAVWLLGFAAVLGFTVLCSLCFRFRLRKDRRKMDVSWVRLPVYVTGSVPTGCMFGMFQPAIYLTGDVGEDSMRHILEHEMTHYFHGDHIFVPLRCLAVAIHWFNPLVWWAARLSRQDGELACDEGTIARLGEGERIEYGRTLIRLSCDHARPADLMLAATTMSDDKKSIKERINMIAKQPKMAVYTLVSLILIAAIAVGCTFTGPVNETEGPNNIAVTDPAEELVVTIPEPGARARPWKSDDFFRFATDEWLPLSRLPKIPDSEEVACASLSGEDLDAYPWHTVAQQFYSEVWFQYYAPYPGLLVTDMEIMEEIIGPRENLYVFRTELYLLERSDSAQKYVCYSFHRSTLSGWDELSSMGWQDMLSEAEMAEYDTPELIREHGSKYAAALADRFPEYLEEKILSGWKLDLRQEALDESRFEFWEDNGQYLYRYAGTDNVITPPDGGIILELPEEWADQVEVLRFKYYPTDNKWILYVTRKSVMEAHKENSNRPEESIGYQDFLFAIFAEPKYESFTADTKMTYMGDDRKYRYFCATSFAQDQEFNDCQLVRSNLIKQIGQEAYDALVGELVVTDEMVMEMVTIGE